MAKKPVQKGGLTIRPRYILLFFLLLFFVLGGVYLSQQTKLTSIAEEKSVLQTQLDGLTVEKERLERMLEYMQTNEYLLQYAREKLGYVYKDDLKFYDETTSGTGGAASAAEATPAPEAATPTPFGMPEEDEGDGETNFVPLPITPQPDTSVVPIA